MKIKVLTLKIDIKSITIFTVVMIILFQSENNEFLENDDPRVGHRPGFLVKRPKDDQTFNSFVMADM